MLSLRMGFADEGNFNEETTTRKAFDLLAEGFGPGFNGPFLVAVTLDSPAAAAGLRLKSMNTRRPAARQSALCTG
jgi:RND superfamily putative drug exporter